MGFLKAKAPKAEKPDVAATLTKVVERLDALEKKMDLVLSQTSPRSSGRRDQSRPVFSPAVPSQAFRQPQSPQRSSEPKPVQVPGPERSQGQPQSRAPGRTRERRERVLHKAICAECKKDCEIPFKPTGERPVYCKECFSKRKNDNSSKGNGGDQPAPELPEVPDALTSSQRQVSVTKKGVGKVTVSEIVRPSARDNSKKKK